MDSFERALAAVEPVESEEESSTQEAWALGGTDSVAARTENLVEGSNEEVVLVGSESLLTEGLLESLVDASDRAPSSSGL